MRVRYQFVRPLSLLFGVVLVQFLFLPAQSFSQSPFYQGKTITMIASTDAAGTGSMRTRAVVSFLQKHIPGNPTIVMEYMPGGGGRRAANHMFRVARPDGLTVGSLGSAILANAVLGEAGVQYGIDRFIYLGSTNSENHAIFITDQRAGLSSMEKLRAHTGLRIGAQSVGHTSYNNSRLFAWIIGLKETKFVTGYTGPEVDAALLQREIDARAMAAASLLRRNPEWVEKREVVHVQAIIDIPKGVKPPRLAYVPDLESFAKRDVERRVLAMQRSFQGAGSPYVVPPGTPGEQVKILQEAFRKTFMDPNFIREYQKAVVEDPSPLMPEELEKVVRELARDPEIIGVFKSITGPGPLPR